MKPLVLLLFVLSIISCNQDPTPATTATANPAKSNINEDFQKLFEEVNVVKMHLFGTNEAEPTVDDYPYVGKVIEEASLKYLGDGLQPNEIGSIYACYRTEVSNFYILRVPGKYASSDLVLASWDEASSKLVKVLDLANTQCDEGVCHQQDAWLTDLDDDRSLELVIRSYSNDNGKISDESFSVLSQGSPGKFTKAPEALASLAPPTSYVMYQKK